MIPALRIGQELFGHVSPAVQMLAADRLGTSPARAEEVATFYVMLDTQPDRAPPRRGLHQRLLLPDRRRADLRAT